MWLYLNGCDLLPIARSTHFVKKCSSHEWPMNHFETVLSGVTLRHWTEIYSKMPLTSFTEDFPARILALQETEKAWKESEAAYFSRSLDCVAKLSPDSSSWRTYRPLLQEEVTEWLGKLPRWGTIVDGALYPLLPLEHYIDAKDGSFLATPTASQANKPIRAPSPSRQKGQHGEDLQDSIGRLNPESIGKKLCPKWVSVLMGYPSTWLDCKHLEMP